MRHLAIFQKGTATKIFSGQKTMDARLSKVRCAPFAVIKKGDIIYIKELAGLVLGECRVHEVFSFADLNPRSLKFLREQFSKTIDLPEHYFQRPDIKFATIYGIKNPHKYITPIPFNQNTRNGWLVLRNNKQISTSPAPTIQPDDSIQQTNLF